MMCESSVMPSLGTPLEGILIFY